VAERERMTNKERRAASREERKRKEAEAAAKAKRDRVRNGAITAVVVLVVGVIVFQAVRPDPASLEDAILISSEEAEQAQEAAGCEVLADREPLPEAFHFEASAAPEPETIYTDTRPTHSGPHAVQTTPPSLDGFSRQIDERSSTHNLEHGAVIVWHDSAQADGSAIASWAEVLNVNGFGDTATRSGAAILAAPYDDPGIGTGKAVAFRAWGTAMDCDEFDETVANAFVARHFGTRGIGPERTFAPYPEDTLDFSDLDVDETAEDEAPLEPEEGEVGESVEEELDEDEGAADATDAPADDEDAATDG
jgi:hypothetical protein